MLTPVVIILCNLLSYEVFVCGINKSFKFIKKSLELQDLDDLHCGVIMDPEINQEAQNLKETLLFCK